VLALEKLNSGARIGTKGDVRIDGAGVAEYHARLFRGSDGTTWIEPLADELWVERGVLRELVTRPRRLDHGDVLLIGDRRLTYHNAASAAATSPKGRRPAWAR
jgi:hypothetical protein